MSVYMASTKPSEEPEFAPQSLLISSYQPGQVPGTHGSPHVRGYRSHDLPALYDICVRTGELGGDARGLYSDDRLLADIYAAPYAMLEPAQARILDDGTGTAVGYIVGSADTPTFMRRFRDEWLPTVTDRYPPGPPAPTPQEGWTNLLYTLRHPEQGLPPELEPYPAHLHIDLLPAWQGRGFGRLLMISYLDGLAAVGVTGVHLGVQSGNLRARDFYDRMGFTRLHLAVEESDDLCLVRPTDTSDLTASPR
jgi:GNAT superfamily N-acetyltransferase